MRQLGAAYLKRRQDELGQRIDPDAYARELQKVKAYIALHNVYGVDLNATAVELAEISLWLDTMGEGLQAPWFGLHLRAGNSLIGARRAVFGRHALAKKAWLKGIPDDHAMTSLAADMDNERLATGLDGGIHHFLLPADGWGPLSGSTKLEKRHHCSRRTVPGSRTGAGACSSCRPRSRPTRSRICRSGSRLCGRSRCDA
ncbi:hypothetical protein NKG05_10980 [Oerskovia sp. M15]